MCPTCGNKYRDDVTECPNDGTKLSGPPAAPPPAAPPPAAPPPAVEGAAPKKLAAPPAQAAAPNRVPPPTASPSGRGSRGSSGYSDDNISGSLAEGNSARTWIVSLMVCLGLLGAFFVARSHLIPTPQGDTIAADDGAKKKGKRKRKRKKRKRRKGARAAGAEETYDDYDWEQDFVVDDREFGDVMSEPDEYEEVIEMREPERYEPTKDEWQPSGSYSPKARFSEPGADSDVVEIDLSSRSSSSPLDETQVKRVLDERKLARCYDPWVNKIPQMRGRVHMDFVVAGDGHVASVKITRSQLRSRVVERCLVQKAKQFRFPRSQGGASTKFDTHFDFTNR